MPADLRGGAVAHGCFRAGAKRRDNRNDRSRDIIRRLETEGWLQVSSRGSHHKFRMGEKTLIVPHPKKDLPLGTARSIARVAGWLKEVL